MNRSGLWLLLCLCGAVLVRPPRAQAADAEQLRGMLQVHPGATCLTSEAVAEQMAQWLAQETIEGEVRIDVQGSTTDPRSARLLVVRGGRVRSHRTFSPGPPRCDHLQAAVGLAAALALKASILEDLGEPLPDDPAQRPRGWSVGAAVLGSYRLLPGLAPGGELSLRYGPATHLAVRLTLLGATSRDVPLQEVPGSFDAVLFGARLDACARGRLAGPLHGTLCLGLLGGGVHVSGTDVNQPTATVAGLAAVTNALELELEFTSHWSISLGFAANFVLTDVRIGLENQAGEAVGGRSLDSPGFAVSLGPLYYF